MLNQTPITRNSTLVLNWIFIPGLLLLVINDHYLKSEFPNWMTGKISDFAGLLIFPMFLQFLFPRLRRFSVLLTGLLFVFFKLPVSDAAIAVYDKIAIIPITRTVDYSDLIALSILPLSDYLCTSIGRGRYKMGTFTPGITTAIVVIPAALVFMATSPPVGYREAERGEILIGKSYKLKISRDEALARLKAAGFPAELDSPRYTYFHAPANYIIRNIVLPGDKDTIECIRFGFDADEKRSRLVIYTIKLKHTHGRLDNYRVLRKYYRRLVHSDIIDLFASQ